MSFLSRATHISGNRSSSHTLELYLDLICPFSEKQLVGVKKTILPLIEQGKLDLKVVIRQVPQPWHASSTLVHEAALGVAAVLAAGAGDNFNAPEVASGFQQFYFELSEGQSAFYDEPTANETPNQTRERLADIAAKYVDRAAFLKAVSVGKGNGGTPVTTDLKLAIKYARQNSIHVTPTVALNGLVEPSISSSFSAEDWIKFLNEKIDAKL
ncbi:hypothetical protein BCR35DRAFT_299771 [Leucosporidium creatinivorum]|uniref:Uncharacterized protein n=1 Tax=Leucosporidium creatinivorum TaxID=106004 RepID=A0A1Y2G357_9BASI|nr:hypothetical protein BCR35DRAFT_299771 [Leucosporidium creatinivorum]